MRRKFQENKEPRDSQRKEEKEEEPKKEETFAERRRRRLAEREKQNSVFQFQFIIPYIENNFKKSEKKKPQIPSLNQKI